MGSLRRVGATVAVVIASLVVASAAVAQSGGGGGGGGGNHHLKDGAVTKYITNKAMIARKAVPTVFPNAQFDAFDRDDLVINCQPSSMATRNRDLWYCGYHMFLIEENRSDPAQWALRMCGTPSEPDGARGLKRSSLLYVEPTKNNPRKPRILGGWRSTCEIDEWTIGKWNERGPDYQPVVTGALPYQAVDIPPSQTPVVEPTTDLPLAPSGSSTPPPGPVPGPLNALPGTAPSKAAHGRSSSTSSRPAGFPTRCNVPWWWAQYPNGVFAIYTCHWAAQVIPFEISHGAGLGLFNGVEEWEAYYWTGYYWKLFQSGQSGPVAGRAY